VATILTYQFPSVLLDKLFNLFGSQRHSFFLSFSLCIYYILFSICSQIENVFFIMFFRLFFGKEVV
jgi:hypothetical protein